MFFERQSDHTDQYAPTLCLLLLLHSASLSLGFKIIYIPAVWLTLPPATDSGVRGESAAAHLQLSLKPDCTLRLSGLVSPSRGQRVEVKVTLAMAGGGSEDQRSSIKEEWRAEVKARTKFVRGYAMVSCLHCVFLSSFSPSIRS